jgi:hypothetical protein
MGGLNNSLYLDDPRLGFRLIPEIRDQPAPSVGFDHLDTDVLVLFHEQPEGRFSHEELYRPANCDTPPTAACVSSTDTLPQRPGASMVCCSALSKVRPGTMVHSWLFAARIGSEPGDRIVVQLRWF